MLPKSFISGISQQLGHVTELSELTREGTSDDIIAKLRSHGFVQYLRETDDPQKVLSACASNAMHDAGITPEKIDQIIITTSSDLFEIALQGLQLADLGRSRLLGISLQDCCGGIATITVASELVSKQNESKHILCIIPYACPDSARLGQNRDMLFSDGTIAFIVSNEQGDFEILASEFSTDPSLLDLECNPSQRAAYLLAGLDNLHSTAQRALRNAGILSSSLRAVFCTNGNSVFQDAIGMSTSTRELIYKDTFARFGHVLACDELIGLKAYTNENPTHYGDLFLLLSWAPYGTAACVLQRCSRNLPPVGGPAPRPG
jgi:3-oxoacyl-[acyl-carrier-protein] synthase III